MAASNAEIVRDLYLATNERDFPRALHHHAEDAAEAAGQVVWTYRLRDGEIVHLQLHRSRPAALEALETARRRD